MMSDEARAVLVFAAYHQLSSGETVKDVVLHDGAGHAADPQAVQELVKAELVTVQDDRAVFSTTGQAALDAVIAAIRGVDLP